MITYACVLRSGGIYTPEWVRKLSRAVGFHASRPHRFVCLSDVDVPCERIELSSDLPGWYAKLELFRPGLFDGPVVYLDLDTLVIGDLTPLEAIADGPLAMLSDFYQPRMAASGVNWTSNIPKPLSRSSRVRCKRVLSASLLREWRIITLDLDRRGGMTSKEGFCVVAPIKTMSPLSTCGRKASCWALLNR